MNGGESGGKKQETLKRLKLHSIGDVSSITSLSLHESHYIYRLAAY